MRKKLILSMLILIPFAGGSVRAKVLSPAAPVPLEVRQVEAQQTNSRFKREMVEYRQARQEWKKAQAVGREYRRADGDKRIEILEKSPEILLRVIDRMIARLQKTKERVLTRDTLSAAEKSQIVDEINRNISWLENKRAETKKASPEEMRGHVAEVRKYWRDVTKNIKKYTAVVLSVRADEALRRGEAISQRLSERISDLKEDGKDVSRAEKLLVDFDTKLDSAREKLLRAKRAFASAKTAGEIGELLREGREFMRQARDYLKEASVIGREAVEELKNL